MSDDWGGYQGRDSTSRQNGAAEFSRLTQLISSNIQKIQQNVSQVEGMVQQLGTQQDSEQLRERMHESQHQTNQLAKDTNRMLKDLANLPSEQRQWKYQRERLTNDLMTILNRFQAAAKQASTKEKASILRARANSSIDTGGFGSGLDETPQTTISGPQRLQIEQNLDIEAIRERERELQALESDILDVNQIFKDLAVMVHEQGEVVDSIEANVESAVVNVQQGQSDIAKAARSQDKSRRKKYTLIAIAVIIVLVLVFIIYITS